MSKIFKLILLIFLISIPIGLACFNLIDFQLAAIITALILGVIGIFQNWIRAQFYCPELDIDFNVIQPNCHKTRIEYIRYFMERDVLTKTGCYYYRLRVSNTGNYRAEKVEVMITEKHIRNKEGQFVKDVNFLPLNLRWSHDGVIIRESIAPSLFRYCDFGFIVHPDDKDVVSLKDFNVEKESKVVLDLDLEVKPYTGSHLIFPGRYRVKIIVVADNSKVASKVFEIDFKDFWDEDEKAMLKDGLTVKEATF